MAAGAMNERDALAAPVSVIPLFVTEVYRTDLGGSTLDPLFDRLLDACRALRAEDTAGQQWADRQGYMGYTSYDSHDNLHELAPAFAELKAVLDVQVLAFMQLLELDLRGKRPQMQRSWVNVLKPGGAHSGHIHPHSAISGTIYIAVPDGAGALEFEDPRHAQMMHAPMRRTGAAADRQTIVAMAPVRGTLLLWESWLRHAVPTNRGSEERISISFNYDL